MGTETKEACEWHCWHDSGRVKTVNPPLKVEHCCRCGITRDVSTFAEPPSSTGHGPYLRGNWSTSHD